MKRFTAAAPWALCILLAASTPLHAQPLPCAPCAGISTDDPFALLPALGAAPRLADDALLVAAFELDLSSGGATPAAGHALASTGATPWVRLVFRTPGPLLEHVDRLQAELEATATLAASRPAPGTRYQIVWRPEGSEGAVPSSAEYAFLVKRASVAVTGEDPDALVVSQPLPVDDGWLDTFYGQEIAAYLDALAVAPTPDAALASFRAEATRLDPGKPVVLDGAPWPDPVERALAAAAAAREAGFDQVLFAAPAGGLDPAAAAPLKILANEFRGELSPDAGTRPSGAAGAWSFVRGEDLSLRVVVEPPAGADRLTLRFDDPLLRGADLVLGDGEAIPLGGVRRTATGLEVRVADPAPALVLRLDRASIAELEGVEEELTVETDRTIPVEEILRRLQAFEDAQNRRIRHWRAVNSTSLRFQAGSGIQTIDATFEGDVFFRPGQPWDWAWQRFYVNGVLWTGKRIPELPLLQPEKAAAMPLEILFTKEYRYTLRGTESVRGRDTWVVDFEPTVAVEPGRTLFRGTVWVDRATSARVRTKAIQLGLEGDVLSNEESIEYFPVDAGGTPAEWAAAAYVLPLRTVAQQTYSIVNTAAVVEKEVRFSEVEVNGPDFDARREEVLASSATMVRDTDLGMRYLVPVEGGAPGEREVKEGFDTKKLLLVGGVLYDESLDFPLPLAGLNYLDLDFRGKDRQLNVFFAGVLGIVNYADPSLFGSRFDFGSDAFAIAISTSDQLYRDGVEQPLEEVKELPARVTLNLGLPIGSFFKVGTSYQLAYAGYSRGDDTADEFVLPSDHVRHELHLTAQYARGGYRLNLQTVFAKRSKWEPWGLPGAEFDPDTKDYQTWGATVGKTWHLSGFKKIGLELGYVGGERLDRFSKYQFGYFGDTRVQGYQSGKIRAEEAWLAHLKYGFEIGQLLRLDGVADAAWATDEEGGLDNELLAGVGVQGSFQGPWETLVQIDVGTPVAGPDSGVFAYVAFLKLFH